MYALTAFGIETELDREMDKWLTDHVPSPVLNEEHDQLDSIDLINEPLAD